LIDRRLFLTSVASATCGGFGKAIAAPNDAAAERLNALQVSLGQGARLGVAAIDTRSGRQIAFRRNDRFAMCSVFKLPLGAFVLWLAERRSLSFADELPFTRRVLLENSPVVEANLGRGRLSIGSLAEAAVRQSDNSAANLLLKRTGGPAALTRFIRACGDSSTRVDRYELALNSNILGDPRDTTTPAAMASLARTLVMGSALQPASRAKLAGWLATSVPKPDRLKAGFPPGWRTGHKPGTGRNGALNDVAISWPPGKAPMVVAAFISGGTADVEARAAVHRAIAALIARQFG